MSNFLHKSFKENQRTILIFGILIMFIIIVICAFIFENKEITSDEDTNIKNSEDIITDKKSIDTEEQNVDESILENDSGTNFEEDVMNDLENLFNKGNGYENIEGDFGFITNEEE